MFLPMQQILWVTDDPSVRRVRHLDRVRRAPAHLPRPAGLSPATQGKKMRKDCLRDLSLHPCLHRGFFPRSGKKNMRAVVVQLMYACVSLWISCTTTKKEPKLFSFPLLAFFRQLMLPSLMTIRAKYFVSLCVFARCCSADFCPCLPCKIIINNVEIRKVRRNIWLWWRFIRGIIYYCRSNVATWPSLQS